MHVVKRLLKKSESWRGPFSDENSKRMLSKPSFSGENSKEG